MQKELIPVSVKLENQPCPLCLEFNDELILKGSDRLNNLPGVFSVVRCKTCGLMRTNPRPTPDTMGFYYPDDYAPYKRTKSHNKTVNSNVPFWKKIIKTFFKFEFNYQRIPKLSPGKMLEVGCASGSFLDQMMNFGWDVTGIEYSESAAENARALGCSIHTGSLETISLRDSEYDLIVAWMVLEHLHDPIVGLKKLHSWLKPGGYLVFSVPNAGSLEFEIFKNAWYALQVPSHLYHYTPKTVEKVLNKSGWKMEKVMHHRLLKNVIASFGYSLKDCGYHNSWTQKLIDSVNRADKTQFLFYPLAYLLSLFGQTGRMTVWARKIDD